MAGLQQIKKRISNVTSTRKITRAMYLIAASKSKRAKEQLESTRPYFKTVKSTMAEILLSSNDLGTGYIKDTYTASKPTYIVLTGDKGMAGGYNVNIVNLVSSMIEKQPNARLLVAGTMGRGILKRKGYDVDDDFKFPVINPTLYRARDIAGIVVELFSSGQTDEVRIVYSESVSALKQQPTELKLLPLSSEEFVTDPDAVANIKTREMLYEPGARQVFDHLVPRYLKGIIYSALIEAFSSEQNARMIAMDGATTSADEMIDKLTLLHNRARQAAITQEITEIVGGIPE